MFHWICPECGCEIAPTVRECPACEGPEQAELVLAGVVEASARTPVPAESAERAVASGSSLTTASVAEAGPTRRPPVETLPIKTEAIKQEAQAIQPEAHAQSEPIARAAQTEAIPSDAGALTLPEADKAPLSIALFEDVADLQALMPEPASWRRKNGHAPTTTDSGPGQPEAAALNTSEEPEAAAVEAAAKSDSAQSAGIREETHAEEPSPSDDPLDAPEAMKLLAAPVAMPQPQPLAAMLTAPVGHFSPEQAQDAAAALKNLSSGVEGLAPVAPATQPENTAQPEATVVQPEVTAAQPEATQVHPMRRRGDVAPPDVIPEKAAIPEKAVTPEKAASSEQAASLQENDGSPKEKHASSETRQENDESPDAGVTPETNGISTALIAQPPTTPAAKALLESGPVSESGPALIPEILDAKAAAERSIEVRAADLLARLNTSREDTERVMRSVRSRTVESRAAETHEVDSQPVEAHALNGKTLNGQPLNGKPVDAKPVGAKPVDTQLNTQQVSEAAKSEITHSEAPHSEAVDESPVAPLARHSAPLKEPVEAKRDTTPPPAPTAPIAKTGKFGRLLRMASEGQKPAAGPQAAKTNQPASASPLRDESSNANVVSAKVAADTSNPDAGSSNSDSAPAARIQADSAPSAHVQADAPSARVQVDAPSAPIELDAPQSAAPLTNTGGDIVAPFDVTTRPLPLPFRLAPISPAMMSLATPAAVAALPKDPESGEATTADAPAAGNVPFSENAPLLANKLRQAPTEPALVDKKLPLVHPAANMAVSFAPAVAIPPSAGSVRPPRSKVDGPAPRYGRLVRNPAIAKSAIRVAAPRPDAIKTPPAPSQTLPGPMLTPGLVAFRDLELMPKFIGFGPQRKRWGNFGLLVAVLLGTASGVGLIAFFTNMPRPEPSFKETAKEAPASVETAAAAVTETAPAPQAKPVTHPIPKSIELSGIRLVGDPNGGGEQVRFTVVNHGPTRFTDGVVYVALRAANARPGQPPLYRFTFPAPNLGPYEAREMSSAAKKISDDASLPGWQELRADIEIGQP